MQVDFNAINAVTKEITIQIPSEEVNKAWEKHMIKTARSAEVPGFRKGKAPLSMVKRMYGERSKEYFLQDSVNQYFDEAAKEHDINYLLFPDVKSVDWEEGQDMIIKVEIEHEPTLEFTQLDHLKIPYTPITLESQVDGYLQELSQQNARVVDVDEAVEHDQVEVEYNLSIDGEEQALNASLYAGDAPESRALPELIGKKTGDTITAELSGMTIKLTAKDSSLNLDNNTKYTVQVMVNSISRVQYPELNDDFARDMDFDSMDAMRSKISDDLRLITEHKEIEARFGAIVGKLFIDNRFDLPMKTISYLAEKEAEQYQNTQYRQYLEYQYKMQISQDLINMYILKALRDQLDPQITDELKDEHITHQAILEDITVEAYKEKHKEELSSDDYEITIRNYIVLRKIAETADFFVPEPEAIDENAGIEDAQIVEEAEPEQEA